MPITTSTKYSERTKDSQMSDGDVCEPDAARPHLRANARVFPASRRVQLRRLCELEVCGEVDHIENESAIPQDIANNSKINQCGTRRMV